MRRLWAAICILAVALISFTGLQPAKADTACSIAQRAALSYSLGVGDVSLAAKARSMCSNPCESIKSFYLLPGLLSELEALVLDAYKTCLANGTNQSGGGSGSPGPVCGAKTFTKVGIPTITGVRAAGNRLGVKINTWSPMPASFSVSWYRNGRLVDTDSNSILLSASDVGKTFSVKVKASRVCYKSKIASSIATRKILANKLPKLPVSQISLSYSDEGFDDDTTYVGITSNAGELYFESDPVWAWEDAWSDSSADWSRTNRGSLVVPLPTSRFLDEIGSHYFFCVNGMRYNIRVTMVVGVVGKYQPTYIAFPVKRFLCRSASSDYIADF